MRICLKDGFIKLASAITIVSTVWFTGCPSGGGAIETPTLPGSPTTTNSGSASDSKNVVVQLSGDGKSIATAEFEDANEGSVSDKTITLSNPTSVVMNDLELKISDPAFQFKGGQFPGVGGTCAPSLAANSTCTVVVNFGVTQNGFASQRGLVKRSLVLTSLEAQIVVQFTHNGIKKTNSIALKIRAVSPPKHAPKAEDQEVSLNEDARVEILLSATDEDKDSLTYKVVNEPEHGQLSGNAPKLVYEPQKGFSGEDSFSFKANDGELDSEIVKVQIHVKRINHAPVASISNLKANEDEIASGILFGSDQDGNALSFSVVNQPLFGTVVITDKAKGTYTFTPLANWSGTTSFVFSVSDGSMSSSATVNVTVLPVNDAPIASSRSISMLEDAVYVGNLSAVDVDGDVLTFTVVGQPTSGTLVLTSRGYFEYRPSLNFNGNDGFTFKVFDGREFSSVATVAISITQQNDAPVANSFSFSVSEDSSYNGKLTSSDVENDPVTYRILKQPTKGSLSSINAVTGNFVYNPNADANGSDSFTFDVSDGKNTSTVATVTINLNAVNDAPIAVGSNFVTDEDVTYFGTLSATDVDNTTLIYSLVSLPLKGTLTLLDGKGNFSYKPALDQNGGDNFTFKVSDGTVESNLASVSILINAKNDLPVHTGLSTISVNEDTLFSGRLTATDIDNDQLAFSLVSKGANGTPKVNADGSYTYLPNTNYFGVDSFIVSVFDGTVPVSKVVTVNISAVNDPPTLSGGSVAVNEDSTYFSNFIYNSSVISDVEKDAVIVRVKDKPLHGSITLHADSYMYYFYYTPEANYNGDDSFTLVANDGKDDSAPAKWSVVIAPVSDTPQAKNVVVSGAEDSLIKGNLIAVNPDNEPIVFLLNPTDESVVTISTQHGAVTIDKDNGSFSYSPGTNYNGSDSFWYYVKKATGGAYTQASVSITVTPVIDPPTPSTSEIITNRFEPFETSIECTNEAGTVSSYTFELVDNASKGTLALKDSVKGIITYTPDANATVSDSFSYICKNEAGDSQAKTVTITFDDMSCPAGGEFGQSGSVISSIGGSGKVLAAQPLPKGRTLVLLSTKYGFYFVKYDCQGKIDRTFGDNGLAKAADLSIRLGQTEESRGVSHYLLNTLSDGSFIVVSQPSGKGEVLKFTASGSIDTTFGSNGKVTIPINDITPTLSYIDKGSTDTLQIQGYINTTTPANFTGGSFKALVTLATGAITVDKNIYSTASIPYAKGFNVWSAVANFPSNQYTDTFISDGISIKLPWYNYPYNQLTSFYAYPIKAVIQSANKEIGFGKGSQRYTHIVSSYGYYSHSPSSAGCLVRDVIQLADGKLLAAMESSTGLNSCDYSTQSVLTTFDYKGALVQKSKYNLTGSRLGHAIVHQNAEVILQYRDGRILLVGNEISSDNNSNIFLARMSKSMQLDSGNLPEDVLPDICTIAADRLPFAGGTGTNSDPYLICSANQLASLFQSTAYNTRSFKLLADIDMSQLQSNSLEPIGNSTMPFAGIFDGNNHTISNLTIEKNISSVGMFGVLNGGSISNLVLKNVLISGTDAVGAVVGTSASTSTQSLIERCFVIGGTVRSASGGAIGGIVGNNNTSRSIVRRSVSTAAVSGTYNVGGIAGTNYGTIENSFARGTVTAVAVTGGGYGNRAGGIAGYSAPLSGYGGIITNCYSAAVVQGVSQAGGLVGFAGSGSPAFTTSLWDIETSGQTSSSGSNSAYGLTSDQMKIKENYTGVISGINWDFTSTWAMPADASTNDGYPYLR